MVATQNKSYPTEYCICTIYSKNCIK